MIKRLPDSWATVTLGELCEGIRGVTYKPCDLANESTSTTVTLLRSNNIQHGALIHKDVQYVVQEKVNPKQLAEVGDIAVCMSNGSKNLVGKSATFNHIPTGTKYTVGSFCSIFRPLKNISSDFVGHLFSSDQFQKQVDFSLAGSAINNLKNSDLLEYKFLKPPFPEQQKIATILTSVDTVIEKTRAQIDKLKHLKTGMMQQLLTQGIGHTEYKDSPVGRIPKAWGHARLEDVAVIQTGVAKNSKVTGDLIEVPYLRVANVQDGYLDLTEIKTLQLDRARLERFMLRDNDILVNEGGDFDKLGRGFIWKNQISPCVHQNHVFVVRTNQEKLLPMFFNYLSGSQYGKQYYLGCAKQTTNLASLNSSQLKQFPVLLPTLKEQVQICEALNSVDMKIKNVEQKLSSITEIKKALMQDLLSGKVRVTTSNKTENTKPLPYS
ncbi:MAG: restriction endonuclease subunit S [Gammaproteobacteria bacterium]|nr:restriction endonuclease subunit S [Gammaproteobacteria bacterium]